MFDLMPIYIKTAYRIDFTKPNSSSQLTPTFLRRSPTILSADIRADGVNGALPLPPPPLAVCVSSEGTRNHKYYY